MSKRYRFGFVVLHYGGMETTINCVETIERLFGADVQTVVVDNCSPDNSGKLLYRRYKDNSNVDVLLNEKNLGFARGNNKGYQYLRNIKHCDMICVMNNDVILQQSGMLERVSQKYDEVQFGVLGPHVTLPNGKENIFDFTLKPVEHYISEYKRIYKLYRYYSSFLYPVRELANNIIRKVRFSTKERSAVEQARDMEIYYKQQENVLLHGCCLIFSPAYIKEFTDCFCPDTFMFKEEELLYLRCREHNLKTLYAPEINVLHLEDVSTNSAHKTKREKELFICGNQAESLRILIQTMKKPFFSICVACYNVEKYITRCLDSILKQDFTNYEVICVDDGSNDHTQDILQEYEKKDGRVHVLANKENKKLVYTRKRAIERARGQYTLLIDSDDSITKGALRTIRKKIKEYDYPDILEFQTNIILDTSENMKAKLLNGCKKLKDNITHQNYCKVHFGELEGNETLEYLIQDGVGQMIWNKAFRTSLLKEAYKYCDRENIYYKEDVYASCIFYALCRRYVGIPERLYNYSFSTGKSKKMLTMDDFREMCKTGDILNSLMLFYKGINVDVELTRQLLLGKLQYWLALLKETALEQQLDQEQCIQSMEEKFDFTNTDDEYLSEDMNLIAQTFFREWKETL